MEWEQFYHRFFELCEAKGFFTALTWQTVLAFSLGLSLGGLCGNNKAALAAGLIGAAGAVGAVIFHIGAVL